MLLNSEVAKLVFHHNYSENWFYCAPSDYAIWLDASRDTAWS